MWIRLQLQGLGVSKATRRGVKRRVRLLLARHTAEITGVEVTVQPAASVDGEEQHRCRIVVHGRDGAIRSTEDFGAGPRAAATAAAGRLGLQLERERRLRSPALGRNEWRRTG